MVRIKGADSPVPAYRLLGVADQHETAATGQSTLVGRELEVHTMTGTPGACDDRSRLGRSASLGRRASGRAGSSAKPWRSPKARVPSVFDTYCESHASEIPFHAVARLFRTAARITGLDDAAARARVRRRLPDADPDDLLLLDDLLGIADPDAMLPAIDPDARRRRLGALINTSILARTDPILYVMEDVHWIDEASESMMADVLAVISQTPALAMITYRPEYAGSSLDFRGHRRFRLPRLQTPKPPSCSRSSSVTTRQSQRSKTSQHVAPPAIHFSLRKSFANSPSEMSCRVIEGRMCAEPT